MFSPQVRVESTTRRGLRWLSRLALALVLGTASPLGAQTLTDHVIVKKDTLMTGVLYAHDHFDEYYEGSLKRSNGNIGKLTTQSVTWFGDYGITDRLNVLAYVPYVWTKASQGVLHGFEDFQDLTVGLKYQLTQKVLEKWGTLRTYLVASGGTPITNYSPDLLPLSIGLSASTVTGRGTVNLTHPSGWFTTGSVGYTVRDDVKLDRNFYFTNGQAFLTDRMEMPDVIDFQLSAGYQKPELYIPIYWSHQGTQGGGDIRRQDQPYASNNQDWSKIGGSVLWSPKYFRGNALRFEAAHVVSGRNVGQSTTLSAGIFHIFHF